MKKFALFLTPLMAITFLTNCGGPKQYTVTFDPNGGTPVASQTVIENKCAVEPKDPTRNEGDDVVYTFKEWQLDGNKFDFATPITKDITLKAEWNVINKFTVTFDSNGGTPVASQTIIENKCATKPTDPTRAEDETGIYTFNEWQLDGTAFDFNTPITKDITLKADWYIAHKYNVSVGDKHDHLKFTAHDGSDLSTVKAIEGQDFIFKMSVINDTNEIAYKLPSALSIYIGDSKIPLMSHYQIGETKEYEEADVIIYGPAVTGNIRIEGSAVEFNYYKIDTNYYGVKSDIDDNPYGETTKDRVITFIKDGEYDYPKAENIFINIDNKDKWISPADGSTGSICGYDASTHKLTIYKDNVKSNVTLVVRTPSTSYPILEDLSWNDIKDYSKSGLASHVFVIGDFKTVKVNGVDHTTRIIGFNQDKDSNGNSIGITFEFKDLISDENGLALATYWNDMNDRGAGCYDYMNSTMRAALNGQGKAEINWFQYFGLEHDKDTNKHFSQNYKGKSVLSMLPKELVDNLATPTKYVSIHRIAERAEWLEVQVNDKLFALSPEELGSSGGTKAGAFTYDFYKNTFTQHTIRKKAQVNGEKGARTGEPLSGKDLDGKSVEEKNCYAGYHRIGANCYWTRSVDVLSPWHIMESGRTWSNNDYASENAYGVAPAFCI